MSDLVKVIQSYLRPLALNSGPEFIGEKLTGETTTLLVSPFRLIQQQFSFDPERAARREVKPSVNRYPGWKETHLYYLKGPNFFYANDLLDDGELAVQKARKILTGVSSLEADSLREAIDLLGQTTQEAKLSIGRYSDVVELIPKNLISVHEAVERVEDRIVREVMSMVRNDRGIANSQTVQEVEEMLPLAPLPRRTLTMIEIAEVNLQKSQLRMALRLEGLACKHLGLFDQAATRIYNATSQVAAELPLTEQITKILHGLGAAVPIFACLYFAGDAYHQLSQGADSTQVATNLFHNTALLFAGFGEGLILQALWS